MRYVVIGAGAVGGVVGARIFRLGHDVLLVARGAHYEAIRERGLRVHSPDASWTLNIPVVDRASNVDWTTDDILLLAVKTQDTAQVLTDILPSAPPHLPIVCVQNAVANERMALRRFPNVYGVFVWCPSDYLEPGVVEYWSLPPKTGILDVGRYPSGTDEIAERVASTFRDAAFYAEARVDIMRWKYRKLLMNLGNAVEALCGSKAARSELAERARLEGVACLNAAGISFVQDDEEPVAREKSFRYGSIEGRKRMGGSTWQSLRRSTGNVETDYLNGEIALLGRTYGIATPVNELLQRLSQQAARASLSPGSFTLAQIESMLR
jgi:2-dehydropantoate 2-reductase